MFETYCGKDCQSCPDRERTGCTGCQSQQKECAIAQCCIGKGHVNCGTCSFRDNCRKLMSKDNMPSYIRRQKELQTAREADAARRAENVLHRAPLMAKWLSVMFWLIIVSNVISLLGGIPSLALICEVATTVCGLGVAWALLQLQSEDNRYRTAAICSVVPLLISLVIQLISGGGEEPNWTIVLSLPSAIVSLVGAYNKCMAHSNIVGSVDNALGEKWEKIWRWNIIALGSLAGSIVLILIIPLLGLLAAFAAATAVVVVAIMELVALYQSAEAFKKKSA